MKMKKKILSFLLAAAVVLGAVLPASLAYAQGPDSGDGSTGVDNPGVETSKTVIDNGDGTYKLRLESYVTGSTVTSTTQKPTDTVLVLDTSGSMDDDYINVADKGSVADLDPQYADYYKWDAGYGWRDMRYNTDSGKWEYYAVAVFVPFWKECEDSLFGNAAGILKIDALRIAANEFIDSTAEKEGDNQIAIVTYASNASVENGLTNASSGAQTLKDTINGLRANGATAADYGMQAAEDIINGIPSDRDSVKTVILFTDGEPNHSNGFSTSVANATIEASKHMKDKGTTVYTIGVYDGANPADDSQNINKYLHRVSSNYPDATSLSNGTLNPNVDPFNGGKSYYLTADNLQALSDIFQSISDEIGGAAAQLDENTVVQDVISDYFQLDGDVSDIVVKTADCNSFDGDTPVWTNEQVVALTPTVDGQTIRVKGFDFSENWVGKNETTGAVHPGKKLILEIPIEPRDGFLGGNNVPTNGSNSGVYTGSGELVENFAVPTVDVPIDPITVTAQDKNVYLMGDLTADQLKAGSTVNVGNVLLDMTADNYGLEAWQNAYVDITATVPTDKTNLTDDDSYTLGVTVSPKSTGTAVTQSDSDTANIYVFKPEITWKDSQLNVGETVNYEDQNYVSTVWKHGNTLDTSVTMVGTAPKLDYGYAPQASAVTQETKVNVTVEIDGTNVTDFVRFLHEDCDFDTCTFNPYECEFIVHIKSFDLTITKTGCNEAIDENQTFVFNVTGPNGFSMQVVIEGNGSTTIKGLPAGTYTVTEDTSWSWRYETDNPTQTVTANDIKKGEATVTFVNTRDNEQWLNGSAYCKNDFSKTVL